MELPQYSQRDYCQMEYATTYRTPSTSGIIPGIIFLLSLFVFTATFFENNVTILVISALWVTLGIFLISISFPKNNKSASYKLWMLFFSIYYLFMLISNYIYVDNPFNDFFYQVDSIGFYSIVDSIAKDTSFDWNTFEANRWPGFMFLSWLIGRTAVIMGEHNSIVLQKTQMVFVCSLAIVYLYNISRLYLSHSQSWKVTLAFGLLTHIIVFTGVFSRDPHLFLLFTIGFYVFLSKWSIRNLWVLILLGVLAAQFRLVNGVFFIGTFVTAYIYLRLKASNKSKATSVAFGVVMIGVLIATVTLMAQEYIDSVFFVVDKYQTYQEGKFAEKTGGNISVITRLPIPLRIVGNFVLSQTYPFPAYKALNVVAIDGIQWMKFPLVIAQVVWVAVWGFLLYGLFKRRYRKMIPRRLRYAIAIAIVLILSNCVGSYEFRRMLGAYPILFLISAMIYFNMSKIKRQKLLMFSFAVQIALLIVYLFLQVRS